MLLTVILMGQQLCAQVIGWEGNAFSSVYSTTFTLKGNIRTNMPLGYSLMTRFDGGYEALGSAHSLVHGSMGYSLLPSVKATAGAIWSSGGPVKPSLGLQWLAKGSFMKYTIAS